MFEFHAKIAPFSFSSWNDHNTKGKNTEKLKKRIKTNLKKILFYFHGNFCFFIS